MGQFLSTNKKRGLAFLLPLKKGQGWSLDLTIAIVLFIAGVIILYFYAINYSSHNQGDLEEMLYEGSVASELILNEDESGILTGNKVNQSKLDDFNANYASRKTAMGVTRNFYFNMSGLEISGNPVSYVGAYDSSPDSSVKVSRITIYKNKPVRFDLFIWKNE